MPLQDDELEQVIKMLKTLKQEAENKTLESVFIGIGREEDFTILGVGNMTMVEEILEEGFQGIKNQEKPVEH